MLFLCLLACSEATEKTEILEEEEHDALIAAIEEDIETLGATAFAMAVIKNVFP